MAREAHPGRELARLSQRLSAGLPRAVLLRGDEPWFRAEALRLVLEAARAAELELARHDTRDPDFELARVLDDLAAAPMFAAARCVVVRGADALLSGGGKAGTPLLAALKAFLASDRAGILVLDAPGLRADHAAARALGEAEGLVLAFRRLYDSPPQWGPSDPRRTELVEWTLERARARGLKLTPDEGLLVATACANDLSALEQKLEALASGAIALDRGRAGAADGRRSLGRSLGLEAAESPFEVAAQMCLGRLERAVGGLEALFQLGFVGRDGSREVDSRALCAVLTGALRAKIRQAERASRALAAGADPGEAMTAAGAPAWPKAREELAALCAARPAADWARLGEELSALERRTRSARLVDVADFLSLALSWRRPAPQGAGGRPRAAASAARAAGAQRRDPPPARGPRR